MPSTMRRRFASENDTSGMNTAHARCTQPWPSVGLQTRRNESAGGYTALFSRSRLDRAQSRQSEFCGRECGESRRGKWVYLRVTPLQSFRFDRGRKSRTQRSLGRRYRRRLCVYVRSSTCQCRCCSHQNGPLSGILCT
jgi:hypothetical protein